MRLNRVESLYVFLLHFHSEGSKEERRPATANPHAGLATHGQASVKAPCKGAADYGQGQPSREAGAIRRDSIPQGQRLRARPTCRHGSRLWAHPLAVRHPQRGSAVGCPQGAAARGQQGQQRRPQGWLPLGRVAADGQGHPPAQGQ
ncbi:hypothetical protein B296_00043791 [Ensete ventricosum]|uniref:Uncharacterized protein n=1 Tax=Ensete ventricosum TaxID=4639 RepID=A0A426WW02_ENSVE|nr:hypothetical protein B296_00043791 [Ensete ventricosum]